MAGLLLLLVEKKIKMAEKEKLLEYFYPNTVEGSFELVLLTSSM